MKTTIITFITAIFLLANFYIVFAQNKNVKNSFDNVIGNAQNIVQEQENGLIDWSEQFIEAKGESIIDTVRFKNKAQARAMAIRGAVVIAQRNLLEIINGVHITGETTVENLITTNDVIFSKVDGVIKGAQMIGEPVEEYGMMVVVMRVSMYDNNGLAPAVYDEVTNDDADEQTSDNETEDVNETTENEQTDVQETNETNVDDTQETEDNFVFNLNGQAYDPTMFPLIVDENGEVLLDFTKIYDPAKGKFPKFLKQSKDILKDAGFKKGVEIIDVIEAKNGKLIVNAITKKKFNWDKIGKSLAKIGKTLLLII
ncbi:MAG: hypothetical protein KAT68_01430 [Bacteroidales bacterium]|nr:hypothetical protein [Bacteroidales bacterium]